MAHVPRFYTIGDSADGHADSLGLLLSRDQHFHSLDGAVD